MMEEEEDTNKSNNNSSSNNNNNHTSHSALDDWQTIASPPSQEQEVITVDDDDDNEENDNAPNSDSSLLGSRLASHVIATLQQYDTISSSLSSSSSSRVATPLQALAVAVHAALRSHTLGFVCTGQPEEPASGGGGGFAAPIRDLPPTRFLPRDWAKTTTKRATTNQSKKEDQEEIIALRYRKPGMGSVVMQVAKINESPSSTTLSSSLSYPTNHNTLFPPPEHDAVVHITLTPWKTVSSSSSSSTSSSSFSAEPLPGSPLVLALSDHVNLESFARARQSALKETKSTTTTTNNNNNNNTILISPALHYKALSKLLTRLVTNFDLGPIHETTNDNDTEMETTTMASSLATGSTPYIDITSQRLPTAQQKVQTTFVPHPTTTSTTTATTTMGNRPANPLDPPEEPRPLPQGDIVFPGRPAFEPAFPPGGGSGSGNGGGSGDFGDDLYPGGITGPPFGGAGPPSFHPSGNLVGPGHPLFQHPNGHLGSRPPPPSSWHDPGQSGNFLRPRFDPYGPPGGPTESPGFDHPRNPPLAFPPPLDGQTPPGGGTGNPNDTSLPMPGMDNHPMPGFPNNGHHHNNNHRSGGGGGGSSHNMFM